MTETLLFIVPIMPGRGGNGLAMRAAALLDALSCQFDVTLYVVPVAGGPTHVPEDVAARTMRVCVLDRAAGQETQAGLIERLADGAARHRHRLAYPRPWACRFSGAVAGRQMATWLNGAAFDAVLAMRLYLAPLVASFLHDATPYNAPLAKPRALLDLDEDDAHVQAQLAQLHERHGQTDAADLARAESGKYARLAQVSLPLFDVVLTASADDASQLAAQHPGPRFAAVPNSYSPARGSAPSRTRLPGTPLRLLLVGNFDYLPNRDAARHLVTDIVPLFRSHDMPVAVDIVGAGGTASMLAPTTSTGPPQHVGVTVHGAVPTLAPWYGRADIAVVPLRAGGGTRIKILEAFAHHVPVVSTDVGAAGLAVTRGEHLLLADNPASFVQACARLARDPALRAHLVANAAMFLREYHAPACVEAALRAALVKTVATDCRPMPQCK